MGPDMNQQNGMRYYILSPEYALRGWKRLPYAIQSLCGEQTKFCLQPDFSLISACDGKTPVVWDQLTEEQKKKYDAWEKDGVIRKTDGQEELLPVQKYRFYPARYKESVKWSITGRCNYRCRHCFMSAPHAAQGEPSLDQLMTMLDAFERCGVRNIHLTGGEPLIRRDFWDLADAILDRGLHISALYSNGLLITDSFLDEMEKRKIRPTIQFSFDGVGHHDWMRGVPGAEKTVTDALERCRERNIPTTVAMVLCRESAGSIRESVKLMASLGVRSMKVTAADLAGEWINEPEHLLSMEEAYEAYLEYIPHYFEDGMPLSLGLSGIFCYDTGRKALFSPYERNVEEERFGTAPMCAYVRNNMYVSPRGKVLPCMGMVGEPIEEQFPNMLETPLEEILDRKSAYIELSCCTVSDYMEHHPECRTCEYRRDCCGGCRVKAIHDHPADYLSTDTETCLYFKDGWKEKKDRLLQKIRENGMISL